MYKELTNCLICGTETLSQVLDMGTQYVVDFVKEKDEDLLKAPLVLMRCSECSLVQLKHRVSPDRLYKKFWYRSSINEQMRDELLRIVQRVEGCVDLQDGDKVLDIGSNDGTLLGWYTKGKLTVGIDPATDLVKESMQNQKVDIGIDDYFSEETILRTFKLLGIGAGTPPKFKVITAIAMFYDVENPVGFLKDCKKLLHDQGVLVIQMNYLHSMLMDTAFDNICHEHLTYFSLYTLKKAIEMAGLDLQGVELSKCNGGSIRAYITHTKFDSFSQQSHEQKVWMYTNSQMRLMEEIKFGLHTDAPFSAFRASVEIKMSKLREYLSEEIAKGGVLYGYGASTRGTVLLQYLYKDGECPLVAMAERDRNKFGLKMVGTWTPIIPEIEAREKATHMLVLPWHFKESIVNREKNWINQKKGTLIFPLPIPTLAQPMTDEVPANVRAL